MGEMIKIGDGEGARTASLVKDDHGIERPITEGSHGTNFHGEVTRDDTGRVIGVRSTSPDFKLGPYDLKDGVWVPHLSDGPTERGSSPSNSLGSTSRSRQVSTGSGTIAMPVVLLVGIVCIIAYLSARRPMTSSTYDDAVSPLDASVELPSQRILTESDLVGKSAWELTLMRNEPFARHGFAFGNGKTAAIRQYFQTKHWYTASVKSQNLCWERMSEVERHNAVMIRRYQKANGLEWSAATMPANWSAGHRPENAGTRSAHKGPTQSEKSDRSISDPIRAQGAAAAQPTPSNKEISDKTDAGTTSMHSVSSDLRRNSSLRSDSASSGETGPSPSQDDSMAGLRQNSTLGKGGEGNE